MILVDATPLQSEHKVRGVGSYTRQLCRELAEQVEPDQLQFVVERAGRDELPLPVKERAVSMWRPHKPAQVYWMYNEVALRYTLSSRRPALFHATDFNGLVTSSRYRTVATVHDLTGLKAQSSGLNPSLALSNFRWYVYYHRKIAQANHLIAISRYVQQDLIHTLGYPSDRITVIPHGVDTALFRPLRGQGRFAHRGPYVAYVGSAERHKNVERLFAAFVKASSEIPSLSLLVGGRWQQEQLDWLDRESQASGLRTRVEHLGFLSSEDQVSLLANAVVFAFPSIEEGFGLPVLEAMACGAPVLTSNRSVLPEVAGEAALLIDPYSVDAIAEGIRQLATNTELAQQLIARGYIRVQDYTWKQSAAMTMAVYERVLAERPNRRGN